MKAEDFFKKFGDQQIISLDDDWIVYCLIHNGDIVYVGKSSKSGFWGRMKDHKGRKQYDSYFTIDSVELESDALKLEGALITLINPRYNKTNLKADGGQIDFLMSWIENRRISQIKKPAYVRNYPSEIEPGILTLMVLKGGFIVTAVVTAIFGYLFGDEAAKVTMFSMMVGIPVLFIIWTVKYNTYIQKINRYASADI